MPLRAGDLPPFTTGPMAWTHLSVSELVRHRAAAQPDDPAYIAPAGSTSWAEYDAAADAVRDTVTALGPVPAAAVYLPDTVEFHETIVGLYRAGILAAATGARTGVAELARLITGAGATVLVTAVAIRGVPAAELVESLAAHGAPLEHLVVVGPDGITLDGHPRPSDAGRNRSAVPADPVPAADSAAPTAPALPDDPVFSVDDVSYLNATSGTTGLPKLVTHTQRRWAVLAAIACRNGEFGPAETFASFVPAPYGFGLWSAHFLPAQTGRPALVMGRFDADAAVALMLVHQPTVVAAVTTQLRMMLQATVAPIEALTSLRVLFTGGEAVPRADAERFEDVTGAKVLQFYGSNETGAASGTTVRDDDETRLTTGGHLLPEAHVRIYDGPTPVSGPGTRRGRPAVRGPLTSHGYYGDTAANAELFTDDGWLLLGDLVEVDDRDRVRVVGRTADLIIRGGKNISAAEVADQVREHPAVAMAAAVGVPDDVFGERLSAVVTLAPGAEDLTLDELTAWLSERGSTREYLPEHLMVIAEMPVGPGGKIAKRRVGELAAEQLRRS